MTDELLTRFQGQNYINLETFRKSGVGVKTPVWFVEEDGLLFVRTIEDSGKVKRIRNNGRVRLVPCDARGGVLGEWVDGQAQLVDEKTAEKVNRLLNRKYGVQKRMFDAMGAFGKSKHATIQILPMSPAEKET